MPRPRRALTRALVTALAVVPALVVPALARPAAAAPDRSLTGTYEVLAKDHVRGDGLEHTYSEVLRSPGRATPITLPPGHGLAPGTRIRVSVPSGRATPSPGGAPLAVRSYERLADPGPDHETAPATGTAPRDTHDHAAPASTPGSPGTTSVLVILAYWTRPDAVTPAKAREVFFGDADRWFREVSYGKAGLAGAVTPWLRISAPPSGQCYAGGEALLADATRRAAALGATYDAGRYTRTVLYFPACGGDAVGVAGWAYEPGTVSWLNGRLDRRTTVHEQGHNYGLGHAWSLSCTSSTGARVTYSRTCRGREYGDPYDAMGRSGYAAHFSGYRKARAGWLSGSRKRDLGSSAATTFSLPPFEKPSTRPLVVVAHSPTVPGRSYWLEYRRPVGMDARLPSGATGGVLVHLVERNRPGVLLDGTPRDASMSTAVVRAGTTWTSPDRVKIAVGAISSTGARVTVTGARAAPRPPGAPRSVAARPGDGRAYVTWAAPASDGGAPVTAYEVAVLAQDGRRVGMIRYGATIRAAEARIDNDVEYTIAVTARNDIGAGPAATATVRALPMPPSARLLSPAPGATVRDVVTVTAQGLPSPVTSSPVDCVYVSIDSQWIAGGCGHDVVTTELNTAAFPNGVYPVQVYVTDTAGRYVFATYQLTFANPQPAVRITAPVAGTSFADVEELTIEAAASVPDDPAMAVTSVVFYERTYGYDQYVGSATAAPFRVNVPVSTAWGAREYVAVATAANGARTRSAPVTVQISHPTPVMRLTEPAAATTVSGARIRLAADVRVTAAASAVREVSFTVDGASVGQDDTAPYTVDWDAGALDGAYAVRVVVTETSGRRYTSDPTTVTVDNALPAVRITAPAAGAAVPHGTVRITGTATATDGGEAPTTVDVFVTGTRAGTAAVAADGTWSFDWSTAWRTGWVELRAVAVTPGGFRAETVSRVHVYVPQPVVRLVSPEAGATLARGSVVTVVITATPAAEDYRTVKGVCFYLEYHWVSRCTDARDEQGRFVLSWQVTEAAGTVRIVPYAVMSDGATHAAGTTTPVTIS